TEGFGKDIGNAVALADLENDGDLDVFIATTSGVKIWINQGGLQGGVLGTFLQSDQILGDSESRAIAVGDINGDKLSDVIVARPDSIKIWMSQRIGLDTRVTFTPREQDFGNGNNSDLALGDLDNDGDLDLFVVRVGLSTVYENDGHGKFRGSG